MGPMRAMPVGAAEPAEPVNVKEPAEPLRVVFMGTPDFAVAALRALVAAEGVRDLKRHGDVSLDTRFSVEIVFTRPDAVSGRGKALVPSPVRLCVEELGLSVVTPRSFYVCQGDARGERPVDTELIARIAAVEPDFIVVAAYGMILPRQVLELPRYGCVNIHASLLPRWRGAAPIQRALLAGDERAGVSIMRMEEGLDTGAYCAVASTAVWEKNAAELTAELAALGANLLVETLPCIAQGIAVWTEQDEAGVTYADKVQKHELALDPAVSAEENLRRVRASTPQAPARCIICDKPVTVLVACRGEMRQETRPPKTKGDGSFVSSFIDKRLVLATIEGSFEVISLKPDGRKEMPASAFAAGIRELQKGSALSALWRTIDQGSA